MREQRCGETKRKDEAPVPITSKDGVVLQKLQGALASQLSEEEKGEGSKKDGKPEWLMHMKETRSVKR